MKTKTCKECKKVKPVGQFGIRLSSICIDCKRVVGAAYTKRKRVDMYRISRVHVPEGIRMAPTDENYNMEPKRFKWINGEIVDTWE